MDSLIAVQPRQGWKLHFGVKGVIEELRADQKGQSRASTFAFSKQEACSLSFIVQYKESIRSDGGSNSDLAVPASFLIKDSCKITYTIFFPRDGRFIHVKDNQR